MLHDLREFISAAQKIGEVKVLHGADWNLEIGAITELEIVRSGSPLLLFDKIKGYPEGYRVVSNLFNDPNRAPLALGLPLGTKGMELVKTWRDKILQGITSIPPVRVDTGPVKENIHEEKDVNLFEFPTPKWHEMDGGRYIGTGCMVIQRDPDDGWVNLGAYRVQVHDERTATIYMSPGRDGDIIRRKYWAKGIGCPVAVVCGQDPLLWAVSSWFIPYGVSEYDYAGGVRGEPIEVTSGVVTDLPIPATAEIVLEGEIVPPEQQTLIEGPFGEWSGYYGSSSRPESAFKVNAILHRNDPIIMGVPPAALYARSALARNAIRAAAVWVEAEKVVPGIVGVWFAEEADPTMMIVSVRQQYNGHAKQAAMVAAVTKSASYIVRHAIVVDDDIDPSNMSDVIWALNTRCDPETSIDIVRGLRNSFLDPVLSPGRREMGELVHSMTFINACRPFHWIKEFPKPCKTSSDYLKQVEAKWGKVLLSG